jgi:aspartate/methionine/tyrosine aminotransferase
MKYNDLHISHQFVAVPSPLSAADGYHIHADKVAEELARGTSVILTSNPRNPTGHALAPDELIKIQDICRGKSQTHGVRFIREQRI